MPAEFRIKGGSQLAIYYSAASLAVIGYLLLSRHLPPVFSGHLLSLPLRAFWPSFSLSIILSRRADCGVCWLLALPILDGVLGLELAWSLALWAIICYL